MKKYQGTEQTPSFLNVGKIVNTQGIKGEVRVMATTDFADERFQSGNKLTLFMPNNDHFEVVIKSHRKHKQFDILRFEGYPTINEVEKLRDGVLKVAQEDLHELSDNEFYYYEIIGLQVEDINLGLLGEIKEILSPGANDVWVVNSQKYGEVLIPYIESVVLDINLETGIVKTELPEGLI